MDHKAEILNIATPVVKAGVKTTEFWATVTLHVLNLLLTIVGVVEAEWAITASAILQSLYNIARGLAKRPGL